MFNAQSVGVVTSGKARYVGHSSLNHDGMLQLNKPNK